MAKCYLLLYSEEKEEGIKDQEDKASFNFAPTEKEKYKKWPPGKEWGMERKKRRRKSSLNVLLTKVCLSAFLHRPLWARVLVRV